MGLFGNKEEKQEQEIQKFIAKYKLNDIDQNDLMMIKEISLDLCGLGLMKTVMGMSLAKTEDKLKAGYLSALVKQNWILIRKLDEISKKLDR